MKAGESGSVTPAPPAPGLRRELTVTSAAALVVSNMIGTGIFTTTGFLAGDLGRPGLVLAVWLVGGVVAMAGCLAYAELGINFPRSGGEYVYVREAWGPAWGFVSGWVSFFAGFCAPIAAGALGFSEYLGELFPSLSIASAGNPARWPWMPGWLHFGRGQWLAVGVIVLFGIVNSLGLKLAARIQNVLTGLKLAVLVAFLAFTFTMGRGHWDHFALPTARTSSHGLAAQFAVSLIFVMYAYSGWNAAAYVAEEMKTPERTLPQALVAGAGIVALLYVALNVAFIFAAPLGSLKGVVRVGAVAGDALFGQRGAALLSGVIALALLSCVSAMMVVGPRVYFAMAQDGCFFAGAARVDPRRQTPVQSILYQTVASALMVLTGTFDLLLLYIGFTLVLFATLAAAGLLRMRRRPDWKRFAGVDWGYPLVPLVFIGTCLWMLAYGLILRPQPSLWGLITVATGGLLYWWKVRKT